LSELTDSSRVIGLLADGRFLPKREFRERPFGLDAEFEPELAWEGWRFIMDDIVLPDDSVPRLIFGYYQRIDATIKYQHCGNAMHAVASYQPGKAVDSGVMVAKPCAC